MGRPGATRRRVAVAVVSVALLSGCADGTGGDADTRREAAASTASQDTTPQASRTRPAFLDRVERDVLDDSASYAVTAQEPAIDVHAEPDGPVAHTLDNPQPSGAPLTFLLADVSGVQGGWLPVYVPVRPNSTTGWVRAEDVVVSEVPYRIEVSTSDNELALYEDGELMDTFAAATGTGDTPTPHGTFFLTELIEPTNRGYGPYAYGLSGFSEVLFDFGGGPGQIGLHGTEDASSIGRAASHGCIRLANADITYLAGLLPLGTPVVIS